MFLKRKFYGNHQSKPANRPTLSRGYMGIWKIHIIPKVPFVFLRNLKIEQGSTVSWRLI